MNLRITAFLIDGQKVTIPSIPSEKVQMNAFHFKEQESIQFSDGKKTAYFLNPRHVVRIDVEELD